ncbi:hypothetical protein [Pseudovibrio sp. FO-BEG1]|uniref:hypothetical protein n=1 Tax=Pseudovibrio sp. (strain FO-BEG1) TaxID=911045 RepID=UPI001AD8A8CB|nr:hypothetical protein [Pseudovibrio sp. FO-BEG1]
MFRVLTILLLVFVTAPHASSMPTALAAQQTADALQMVMVHAEQSSQMTNQEMPCCCCEEDSEATAAAVACIAAMVLAPDGAAPSPAYAAMSIDVPAQNGLLAAHQSSIDRPPIQWAA